MAQHQNNEADRKLGRYWEEQFCQMAQACGLGYWPLQWDWKGAAASFTSGSQHYILPDILIWKGNQYQYHEIKHKNPTKHGSFSLEAYRFSDLQKCLKGEGIPIFYTIHNHDLAGGCEVGKSNIAHWVTVSIEVLSKQIPYKTTGYSWVNGKWDMVEIFYWSTHYWTSLEACWKSLK